MICHQKLKRDELLSDDIAAGFPIDTKVSQYTLQNELFDTEHRVFIKRYEWLGTVGFNVKWCFTARYNGHLGGVVLISEPNGYQFDKKLEALIQRGACASWTPKNLASRLIMFSCKWMVNNTDKRIFVGYSDPEAGEIGTIYQACNFDYLGGGFGAEIGYKLPNGKIVTDRYFTRTSSNQRWAKELGIKWDKSWTKNNGFQNIVAIPEEIRLKLKAYGKLKRSTCEKVQLKSKGKYVLLLKRNKKERIEKCWITYSYPKRSLT